MFSQWRLNMTTSSHDNSASTFTNRLAKEKSPYLLQHQHNPIDWHAWNEESLEAARREDKPIFLSIGYSACHWCHVMAHESFENEAVAAIVNAHFIPIKVDREERPDVDEIYMTAVQMMTGSGGWPLSVFLMPDGRPFYGGTYFPPEDGSGRIGFGNLAAQLGEAWAGRRSEIEQVAETITADLQRAVRQNPADDSEEATPIPPEDLLRSAVADMQTRFDAKNGGFGRAPKFPPHHALRLLIAAVRHGDTEAAPLMLARTLDRMALGGVYDQIGGGFHRYSTDASWLLPHFEKMLYDNALLARIYADAFLLTGRPGYARVARETCDWVLRDLTHAETGGFYAALDADSEGVEGKYYVWTTEEVRQTLGDEAARGISPIYNLQAEGNFREEATGHLTGANIPYLSTGVSDTELPDSLPEAVERARLLMRMTRQKRVAPETDDKIITAWNGLMIGALAFCGTALNEPRYTDAAVKAAEFCLTTLMPNGQLMRRWAKGEAAISAYLDDYAFLADGLLDLHTATGEMRFADGARHLADVLISDFSDNENGGFFYTAANHETLIARSKDLFDGALPSANGVSARVLGRLGTLPDGEEYGDAARNLLRTYQGVLARAPQGTQTLIEAALLALPGNVEEESLLHFKASPAQQIVVPGGAHEASLTLKIAQGYYIAAYKPGETDSGATVATLTSDLPASVGPIRFGASELFGGESVYRGIVELNVPIMPGEDAAPGVYRLGVTLRYRAVRKWPMSAARNANGHCCGDFGLFLNLSSHCAC